MNTEMKKLLFFTGDIETQGYFSLQIAEAMKELGHEVFIYDLSSPWKSTEKFFDSLRRAIQRSLTLIFTA